MIEKNWSSNQIIEICLSLPKMSFGCHWEKHFNHHLKRFQSLPESFLIVRKKLVVPSTMVRFPPLI